MVILGKGVNQSNLRVGSVACRDGAFVTPLEPERTRIFQQAYPPKDPYRPYLLRERARVPRRAGRVVLNTDTNEVYYRPRPGENMAHSRRRGAAARAAGERGGTLDAPVHHLQFRGLTFEHTTWLLPNSEGYVGDQASIVFTQPLPPTRSARIRGIAFRRACTSRPRTRSRSSETSFRHMGASALNLYSGGQRIDRHRQRDHRRLRQRHLRGPGPRGQPERPARDLPRNRDLEQLHRRARVGTTIQSVGIMARVHRRDRRSSTTSCSTCRIRASPSDGAGRTSTTPRATTWSATTKSRTTEQLHVGWRRASTRSPSSPGRSSPRTTCTTSSARRVQGGFNISGIYLDEGSSQITVRDNVLVNTGDRRTVPERQWSGNLLVNNGARRRR